MNPYQAPYPTGAPPQGMPSMPTAPNNYYGYQGYPNVPPTTTGYDTSYAQPQYNSQVMPQPSYAGYATPNNYGSYPAYNQQSYGYGQQPYGYDAYGNPYPSQGGYDQNVPGYGYPANAYASYPTAQQYGYFGDNNETPAQESTGTWSAASYEQNRESAYAEYPSRGDEERSQNPSAAHATPSAPTEPLDPPSSTDRLSNYKPERPAEPPKPKPRIKADDAAARKKNEDGSIQSASSEVKRFNEDWRDIKEGLSKSEVSTTNKENPEELSGVSSNDPVERARYKKNLDALANLMTDVNLDELDNKP